MGEVPDWLIPMRAARYLGVPPWDLDERPYAWVQWATAAMNAESKKPR